jgi:sn1-specific diacylglycerol lipase
MRTLHEGARFARYALAIYTWVLYLYVHPVSGIPKLYCSHGRCCCCSIQQQQQQRKSRQDQQQQPQQHPMNDDSEENDDDDEELGTGMCNDAAPQGETGDNDEMGDTMDSLPCWMGGRIEGDTLCETHKAGLLLQAGLDESDLIYAQLRSSFTDNPYCIVVDHKWKCVVLSIRGTFSLEDCVTDVSIKPESLQSLGEEYGFDGTNQYCHGGVLLCVRNVYRDLQRHNYLEKFMLRNGAVYRNYTLRLVGHSLGGAIATVLSYMLRRQFPNLQCINYSPPGCSLTWQLAVGCRGWCHTFVLDCDLVPRLSLDTMDQLRNEVLELIGRIKIPKFAVARKFVRGTGLLTCRGCFDEDLEKDRDYLLKSIQDMLHDRNDVPDSEYQRQLREFNAFQEERRTSRLFRSVKLFPPGRVVHLMKTGEKRSCCHSVMKCITCCMSNAGFEYTPVWIKNDDLNEIVVSATMGTDHFPNRICTELERLAKIFDLNVDEMQRTTSFPSLPAEP